MVRRRLAGPAMLAIFNPVTVIVMKKNKKQQKRIKSKNKTTPRKVSHEIVVKVQSVPTTQALVPTNKDLGPVIDGGKYMIPKTWVSEKQVLRIIQKTPPQFVLKRKGKGGMTFDYVPGSYFKKVLNFTFGWNWDFKITKQEIIGEVGESWAQVVTLGSLTVKDDQGHTITKEDNGKADIKYLRGTKTPMDIGNDFKASATDCLKRCGAQLGIASDVYGRGELKSDVGYEVPNTPTTPPMASEVPKTSQDKQVLLKGQVIGPDGQPTYLCKNDDMAISNEEYNYSNRIFGKSLCRDCQKTEKAPK